MSAMMTAGPHENPHGTSHGPKELKKSRITAWTPEEEVGDRAGLVNPWSAVSWLQA